MEVVSPHTESGFRLLSEREMADLLSVRAHDGQARRVMLVVAWRIATSMTAWHTRGFFVLFRVLEGRKLLRGKKVTVGRVWFSRARVGESLPSAKTARQTVHSLKLEA
jgi:hypothetical protein